MASTIKLKNGSGAPLAADLVTAEPALDLTNKRLYTEDSGGTVIEVGTNPAAEITANAGIALPDNQKATFGAGDDLEIYHDGTNSYIDDSGTGDLYVRASDDLRLQVRNDTDTAWASSVICNDGGETSLHYNGIKKLATTNTGIDVTGTVTADGLTVENTDATITLTGSRGTGDTHTIATAGANSQNLNISADDSIFLRTADTTNRIGIFAGGDISFYEDTGTTAKFFWDASAESLGIGTTSPQSELHVKGEGEILRIESTDATGDCYITFRDSSANKGYIGYGSSTHNDLSIENRETGSDIFFQVGTTEAMRIDSSGTTFGTRYQNFTGSSDPWLKGTNASGTETSFIKKDGSAYLAGNLGIGRSVPSQKFHVEDITAANTSTYIQVVSGNTGNAGIAFGDSDADLRGGVLYGNADDALRFFKAGFTEGMRLDSSGNLLVGTTDLDLGYTDGDDGVIITPNGTLALARSTTTTSHLMYLNKLDNVGNVVYFAYNGSEVGDITITASSTAYNTVSDYRLKENVVDMTGAVDRVKALKPSQFNFIADSDTTVDGFLAHEVADVVPEAITGTKDAVDADGNPEYQGIDQSKLVPLLTGALQEAIARIETLEAEVATLKGN